MRLYMMARRGAAAAAAEAGPRDPWDSDHQRAHARNCQLLCAGGWGVLAIVRERDLRNPAEASRPYWAH